MGASAANFGRLVSTFHLEILTILLMGLHRPYVKKDEETAKISPDKGSG
jgi:hypothetical protein